MQTVVFTAHAAGRENLEEVRLVLDAVARRISRDAWAGSLSDEAIQRVRLALKKMVRRKAFVAARQVQGFSRKRMVVLWTLGRANFTGADGDWVIKSKSIPSRGFSNVKRLRRIGEIAYAAGMAHDLGKNTQAFQDKLRSTQRISDRFRHELLSLAQLRGKGWNEDISAWRIAAPVVGSMDRTQATQQPFAPHNRPPDWMEYLVLTHHRLPGVNPGGDTLDLLADHHINDQAPPTNLQSPDALMRAAERSGGWFNLIEGRLDFVLSRLSLMLADHYVSAVREATRESQKRPSALRGQVFKHLQAASAARANLSQSLAGHLRAVGAMARVIAPTLDGGKWAAGLSALFSGRFADKAGASGRFAWQSQAVALCRTYGKSLPQGVAGLALVGSSTGSGKTRACMAMADALADPAQSGVPLRVTVALGLRTLTLQTGQEYREVFGLESDEMSVLIGSRAVMELDANRRSQSQTQYAQDPLKTVGRDEGRDFDEQADIRELTVGDEDASRALELLPFIEAQCSKPGQKRYLDAPVMVTTLDQIIQAADHRRAGWILPWLRLSSSSALILDEVDGYDLSDFPPLLRLVEFAAMLGVPVIASSATLYPALVAALVQAWRGGMEERARFLGVAFDHPSCLLVGDEPGASRIVAASDIEREYAKYAKAMTCNLAPRRLGRIIGEGAQTALSMFDAMKNACLDLHTAHRLATPAGPGLSVGLVRIAHVHQAVDFARFMDRCTFKDSDPVVKVVLYHARNTVLARQLIERRLDAMLNRKHNPLAPLSDRDLARTVDLAAETHRDVCVLVVATPVEEVGRDHDFDWAVIEPSSARSIVQACGRVLRHRNTTPEVWNVGVMARNFREIENIAKGRRALCFSRPGFERSDQPFPDHDTLNALFERVTEDRRRDDALLIDARMCLTAAPRELGTLENASIANFLDESYRKAWVANPVASMVQNHYAQYRLRKGHAETEVVLDFETLTISQSHKEIGQIEGAELQSVHLLEKTGLWRDDWNGVRESFDGMDTSGAEFRTLRIPARDSIITSMMIDPLYGDARATTA